MTVIKVISFDVGGVVLILIPPIQVIAVGLACGTARSSSSPSRDSTIYTSFATKLLLHLEK